MDLNWVLILSVAVSTIGLVAWMKKLIASIIPTELPTIVWVLAMPLSALGLGLLYVYGPQWSQIGIVSLAIVQIGYDNIIKLVQTKIETLK